MNDAALGFHVTLSLARERSSDTFSCHQPQSPRTLRTNEARSQMTAGFLVSRESLARVTLVVGNCEWVCARLLSHFLGVS
ncbi:hypothetical protein LEMLEM_LOCUS11368 [Lemmus lemmus]